MQAIVFCVRFCGPFYFSQGIVNIRSFLLLAFLFVTVFPNFRCFRRLLKFFEAFYCRSFYFVHIFQGNKISTGYFFFVLVLHVIIGFCDVSTLRQFFEAVFLQITASYSTLWFFSQVINIFFK